MKIGWPNNLKLVSCFSSFRVVVIRLLWLAKIRFSPLPSFAAATAMKKHKPVKRFDSWRHRQGVTASSIDCKQTAQRGVVVAAING
jgi:hypothetical protein